jgi:hypothetical protein
MKLSKIEKRIINFAYPLQQKPGFTKRKSLLHFLSYDETSIDKALDKLILHRQLKLSEKKTNHNGICYELTEEGIKLWQKINGGFWEKNWKLITKIILPIAAIVATIATIFFGNSAKNETNGNQSPIIMDSEFTTINYSNTKDPNYLNARSNETKGIGPIEITKLYFFSQNSGNYRLACSLFPKSKCDSDNGEDISQFSREKMKYLNGYEDVEVWEPEGRNDDGKVVCVKYKYLLKSDANPGEVTEIFSFHVDKREDGEWEIISRICEKKFKEGVGIRSCPFPASQNYCI